jgi:hypothetical protein
MFSDRDLMRHVLRLSGGHVRSLLVMITEMLDWVDDLPIGQHTVDRYATSTAKDLARGLSAHEREIVRQVDESKKAVDDPAFFDLLRNLYVFAYEAGAEEYWYGLNPLLREIDL